MSLVNEDPSFGPSAEDTDSKKTSPTVWLTVLAVGWVLYELTAQPAIGVMAVCIKFGWEDFLTARWLRQIDPQRKRGRACFWLYLSSGLWKTALVALAMIIPYTVILVWRAGGAANQAQALEEVLTATCLTMVGGFALSALTSSYAAWLAYCGGLRLWLSRGVHRARRRNAWPPSLFVQDESNRLGTLLLTIVILIMVPAFILGILLCIPLLGNPPRNEIVLILVLCLAAIPLSGLVIRDFVVRRLMAREPSVCWDPKEQLVSEWGELEPPWQDVAPSGKVE